MPRVQTEYQQRVADPQAVASPQIQQIQHAPDVNASKAFQLAKALGAAEPVMNKFLEDRERQKTQEQEQKLAWYVEQFRQDHQGNAVSDAQVRARFPETVPVIAARIAQVVGSEDAQQKFGMLTEEILKRDDLRLNTALRTEFIKAKKQELFGQMGEGNDFYAAGFASSIEKQLSQHETSWQQETAAHHQKLQADGFAKVVQETIYGKGDLKAVDKDWGASSSLNNLERKKIVTETAIDAALASGDASILDNVPPLFHTPESQAKFARTKIQVTENQMSQLRHADYLQNRQREEDIRNGKLEIVQTLAEGQRVDPRIYKDNPELFNYAISANDQPVIDPSISAATANRVKESILGSSTVGRAMSADEWTATIMSDPGINFKDKDALIKEIPKLLEGHHLMKDETLRQSFSDRLNPLFDMLEKNPLTMLKQMGGKSPRTEVMRSFERNVQSSFTAYYQDNGKWPTGFAKKELVDKEIERAEAHLEKLANWNAKASSGKPSAPAPTTKQPQQIKLPNGVVVTRVE